MLIVRVFTSGDSGKMRKKVILLTGKEQFLTLFFQMSSPQSVFKQTSSYVSLLPVCSVFKDLTEATFTPILTSEGKQNTD